MRIRGGAFSINLKWARRRTGGSAAARDPAAVECCHQYYKTNSTAARVSVESTAYTTPAREVLRQHGDLQGESDCRSGNKTSAKTDER